MNMFTIKLKVILAAILLATAVAAPVLAQELTAELERAIVSVGNPVYLNVTFSGSQNVAKPDMPPVDGAVKVKYIGPSSEISIVNGRTSQFITHSYLVIPGAEGSFQIGPFSVEYKGKIYSAPPVTLKVGSVPVSSGRGTPSGGGRYPGPSSHSGGSPENTQYFDDNIFLVIQVPKKEVYINEKLPVVIKLYVTQMGLKDIEYPKFDYEGFSAGQWSEPDKTQEFYNGREYNVLTFKRDLFGIKEGKYVLGPASLGAKAVIPRQVRRRPSSMGRSIFNDDFFSDMFNRTEAYPVEATSDHVPVTILGFPGKDKPKDFTGAVGDFDMEVNVDPLEVKVGDPITVRIIISGSGNMDTVTAPKVDDAIGMKMYEPQATKKGNKKIYEQIMIPRTDDVKEIPAISFSFLNPGTGRYTTLRNDPVPVSVLSQPDEEKGVKIVSMGTAEKVFYPPEQFGQDIAFIKSEPGVLRIKGRYLYKNIWFWMLHVIPMALFFSILFINKKRVKIKTDTRYARSLKAPATAKSGIKKARTYLNKKNADKFYDTVHKTLQTYLSNKFGLPKGAITLEEIELKLKGSKNSESTIAMIKDVFAACDIARYTSSNMDNMDAGSVYDKLRKIIDFLQRNKI